MTDLPFATTSWRWRQSPIALPVALVGALLLIVLLGASTRVSFGLPFLIVAFGALLAYAVHNLRFGIAATISGVLLVPLQLGIHIGPSSVSLGRVIEFAFIAGWAAGLARNDGPVWRRSPVGVPMAAFLLGFAFSMALNGPHLHGGLFGAAVRRLLVFGIDYFLFFYAVLSVFAVSRRHVVWVLRVIAATVVFISLLAMLEKATGRDVFTYISPILPHSARAYVNALASAGEAHLHRGLIVRARSTLAGPNQLGAVTTMTLPLIIYFAGRARARLRVAWSVGAFVTVLAAVFTGSRSAIIALFLVVIVQLLAGGRGTAIRRGGVAIAITVAVVFALSGSVRSTFVLYFHALQGSHDTSVKSRTTQAHVVFDQFREHPIAGYGPGTFSSVELHKRVQLDPSFKTLDNSYLGTLGELGLAGEVPLLAITLGAPFLVATRLRRARAPDDRSLLAALLAGLTAFAALTYFFDELAFYAEPRLYMVLLAAALVVAGRTWPMPHDEAAAKLTDVSRGGITSALNVARQSVAAITAVALLGAVGGALFGVTHHKPYVAESSLQIDRPRAVADVKYGHHAEEQLVSIAPTIALTATSDATLEHVRTAIATTATISELRDDVAVATIPGRSYVLLGTKRPSRSGALSSDNTLTGEVTKTATAMGYSVEVITGPSITATGGSHLRSRMLIGLLIGITLGAVGSLAAAALRRSWSFEPTATPQFGYR